MSCELLRKGVSACWIGAERSQLMKEIGQKSGREIVPIEGGIKDLNINNLINTLASLDSPGYAVLNHTGKFYVINDHDYSKRVVEKTQDLLERLRILDLPTQIIETIDLKCLATSLKIDLAKYPIVYHSDDCSTTYE